MRDAPAATTTKKGRERRSLSSRFMLMHFKEQDTIESWQLLGGISDCPRSTGFRLKSGMMVVCERSTTRHAHKYLMVVNFDLTARHVQCTDGTTALIFICLEWQLAFGITRSMVHRMACHRLPFVQRVNSRPLLARLVRYVYGWADSAGRT